MNLNKVPMTRQGFDSLEKEKNHLKNHERISVIEAISEAREHGDLSENAEYHAAREKQGLIEGRIQELEAILSRAEVIDPSKIKSDKILFGATVKLEDLDTGETETYKIVNEYEANIANGSISYSSPIAKAIIGKEKGDFIELRLENKVRNIEIKSIEYK